MATARSFSMILKGISDEHSSKSRPSFHIESILVPLISESGLLQWLPGESAFSRTLSADFFSFGR